MLPIVCMHIPDGFLDAKTAIGTSALSLGAVGWALRQARRRIPAQKLPLLGLSAAFIFAAQMLNFPVVGGTSGHLVGSVLISCLLGPSAGIIVMTAILIVQCLGFADGGLTALGANILNMGVVGSAGGYLVFRGVERGVSFFRGSKTPHVAQTRIFAAMFAAWVSVVMAAIVCSSELAFSHTVQWGAVFPIMTWLHMLIGVGEALITGLVLAFVTRVQPQIFETDWRVGSVRELAFYGLLLTVTLAFLVSPFASHLPDGLDRTTALLGLRHRDLLKLSFSAPLADYRTPGMVIGVWSTSVAGAIGTVIMFGFSYWMARRLVSVPKKDKP